MTKLNDQSFLNSFYSIGLTLGPYSSPSTPVSSSTVLIGKYHNDLNEYISF